ncbi:tetratricopeptide repeat protein [Comamonas sp. Tr-654]|uniref:tetratricopeptide repeat protein n=1 Tax=Comamonas sp. Tr-654 TaxID=2608341 RepID=UPI0014203E3B|nr:tetratricopeptide repeat protein [Comamonas sp. Tr-654]NIF82317.1 tetratricopeptide repeat protein [Comamonas sp. Tr-654]
MLQFLLSLSLCLTFTATAAQPSEQPTEIQQLKLQVQTLQATAPQQQEDIKQLQQQTQKLTNDFAVFTQVSSKQLDMQDKRISDLSIYIAFFGILITLVTFVINLGTYFTAKGRAKQEAEEISKKWFADNGSEFTDEIDKLRNRVSAIQNEVEEHANKTKKKMDEDGQKIAIAAQLKIIPSDPSLPSKPSDEDLQTVNDANQALKSKPENDFTAEDHFVRGLNEFNAKRFDSALISFEKAIDIADTVPVSAVRNAEFIFARAITLDMMNRTEEAVKLYNQIQQRYDKETSPDLRDSVARALVNKSVALGKLGKKQEAIELSEYIARIYGNDDDPNLREQTARAIGNKGFTLAELGKEQEAIQTFEEIVKRYADDPEPAIQRVVANTRQLLNELRGDNEPEAEPT